MLYTSVRALALDLSLTTFETPDRPAVPDSSGVEIMANENSHRSFGWRAVVLTSLTTLSISVLGGVLISIFIERPKPALVVEEVGFGGGEDLIELQGALVEVSHEDTWGRTFRNFESFESLRARDISSQESLERIRAALRASEGWLRDHYEDGTERFTDRQLQTHPAFNYEVVLATYNGMLRRRELQDAPMGTNEDDYVYPLYSDEGDPVLHRGSTSIRFPTDRFLSADQRRQNRLLASSFATGNALNILHYTEAFISDARETVEIINTLRARLHEALLSNARVSANILVTNTGRTGFTLEPNFVFEVHGQDFTESYTMRLVREDTEDDDERGLLAALLESDSSDDEGRVVPQREFLPRAGGVKYTMIGPGETSALTILATEALEDPRRFMSLYEAGLLCVAVAASRTTGQTLRSEQSMFGANANESDERRDGNCN